MLKKEASTALRHAQSMRVVCTIAAQLTPKTRKSLTVEIAQATARVVDRRG